MNKVERHAEICKELNAITDAKNKDYGDSTHFTYEKFGMVSYLTRLYDKLNRATTICNRDGDAAVKSESLEDTLLDMANYCIMAVDELRESRRKTEFLDTESRTITINNQPLTLTFTAKEPIKKYKFELCQHCDNKDTSFCELCSEEISPMGNAAPSHYCID